MTTKTRAAVRPKAARVLRTGSTGVDAPARHGLPGPQTDMAGAAAVLPAQWPGLTHNLPYDARPWKVQRGLLWSAELGGPRSSRVSPRIPVEFELVERQQLPQLLATAAQVDSIAPEALLRRYDLGRQCFAGWVDDSLAAYGWLTRGPEWVREFERELNVENDEAYIWDCATLPVHRRLHLFSALIGRVAAQLAQEGLRRSWIIAVVTTASMNRDIADAGFQPALRLTYVRLFNWHVLLTTQAQGMPAPKAAAALRLLKQGSEHAYGGLLTGASRLFRS